MGTVMATGIQDETRSGNPYIDPLLSGWRWNDEPVTYGFAQTLASFPSTDGYYELQYHFAPVNEMMRQNLRAIFEGETSGIGRSMTLTPVSGFMNINLRQTDPETTPTDIRIGMSSYVGFGYAYVPGESPVGVDGDMWFGRSGNNSYQIQFPANGSYGHYTELWGVGKVLGLKHGWLDIPDDKDFKEYTVMTYHNAPAAEVPGMGPQALEGGIPEIQNLRYNYSQTFMMLDIAALQQMYGANYNFRSDDTVYQWIPTTGEVFVDGISKGRMGDGLAEEKDLNKIFQTIWDGGGRDTYDLSNYKTDLKINLAPGEYSTFSQDQRIYIDRYGTNEDNYYARGNVYNSLLHNDDPRSLIENAKGGSGNDSLTGNIAANQLWGNGGNDTFTGGAGEDVLDGGAGTNTAIFSGARANYTITSIAGGSFTITDNRSNGDGEDILVSINFAKFSDQTVTLAEPSLEPTTPPPSEPTIPTGVAPIVYHGMPGADFAWGGQGDDQLYGHGGKDRLNGLEGNDYLVGGQGKDAFIFSTMLGTHQTNRQVNFDTIADFSVKDDTIWLANAVFTKLGKKAGTLNKDFFVSGTRPKDKKDCLIYNKKTGVLSYDADGSGTKSKAVEFAQLKKNLKLTHNDFVVI